MARGWLARLDPWVVAAVVGAAMVILTIMGSLYLAGLEAKGFDPNGETNFPSAFSAFLLWSSAGLALALALAIRPRGALLALAALFAFLGLDELIALHERLQDRTGVSGTVLYAPLALAGAVVLAVVWRQVREIPGVTVLMAGGALAWGASQGIDGLQPHHTEHWSIIPEELLEMTGSALFLLALLVALRAVVARDDAQVESLDSVVSAS